LKERIGLNMKRVAVLGGGAGGHAMAVDLTLKGIEVRWCELPEFAGRLKPAIERREIQVTDIREDLTGKQRVVRVSKATTNFGEAVKSATHVMVAIPAIGHELFFTNLLPYLEDGQTIIISPGNFGALYLANMLKEKRIKREITLAELNTLPYGCRLVSPGHVRLMSDAQYLCLATFPGRLTDKVFGDVKSAYPLLKPCENVVATSMSNQNPSVHPIGSILNVGWIETLRDQFYLYRLGLTPSVLRASKAVFDEIQRVADSLETKVIQYPEETFCDQTTIMGATFGREKALTEASGPSSIQSRYITEDVPYGLVPIARLASKLKVHTPVISAVITLASVVNGTDYFEKGRSLEELGIADLNKRQLIRLLRDGQPPG
jgi:opine dehydrogenase